MSKTTKQTAAKQPKQYGIETEISAAVAAGFLAGVAHLPSAGFFSSLPIAVIGTLVAHLFCKKRWLIIACMALFPWVLGCAFGFSMQHALFIGISCGLLAFFTLLAKRAYLTVKATKTTDKPVYVKSLYVLVCAVIVTVAGQLVSFGNPVSALLKDKQNKEFIRDVYPTEVTAGKTYFDTAEGAYLTEIVFDEAVETERYYLAKDGRNDYADYCLETLYTEALDYFERKTTVDAAGVRCYLDVEPTQIRPHTDYRQYLDQFEYYVPISAPVISEQAMRSVMTNLMKFFTLSEDFQCKSILAVGTDGKDGVYAARMLLNPYRTVTYETHDKTWQQRITDKFGTPALFVN